MDFSVRPAGFVSLEPGNLLAKTFHGYTGHEQIDQLGLIHMNGRVYDPQLGRFLQADPLIQAPANGQSLNRYSYVFNNPLSYTDPSGFSAWNRYKTPVFHPNQTILKAIGPSAAQVVVSVGSMFCGLFYALCVAAGTYDMAIAFGASTKEAFRSGATAGIAAYVFSGGNAPSAPGSWSELGIQIASSYAATKNPKLGQVLSFIAGNYNKTWGEIAQNAVGNAMQYQAGRALNRWAQDHGMTLQDFNILLGINSWIGLKLAGTTFNADNKTVSGFTTRERGEFGEAGGWLGIFWDLNDTLLVAQGLPDAVMLQVINSGYGGHLTGHSLGAARVNLLYRMGAISSATTWSLPAFAYPAAGTHSACISADPVCGGRIFTWLRPSTRRLHTPESLIETHNWGHYERQW